METKDFDLSQLTIHQDYKQLFAEHGSIIKRFIHVSKRILEKGVKELTPPDYATYGIRESELDELLDLLRRSASPIYPKVEINEFEMANVLAVMIQDAPRERIFKFINEHKEYIAITQESLRRYIPKTFNESSLIAGICFLDYYMKLADGMSPEDARNYLHASTPTNLYVTIHLYMMSAQQRLNIKNDLNDIGKENVIGIKESTPKVLFSDIYSNIDKVPMHRLRIGRLSYAIKAANMVYRLNKSLDDYAYLMSIVDKGHFSILEHIPVVVEGKMSVAALNQLIRHRHTKVTVKEYNNERMDLLGSRLEYTLETNLRELLAIISERSCSRAQDEIRFMAENIINSMDLNLLDPDSKELSLLMHHVGPKCFTRNTRCLEPCKTPYVREITKDV